MIAQTHQPVTITLNPAELFFHDHAGWCTPPGRERCAILLADAEQRLGRSDAEVTWEYDPEPWQGDEPYDGPLYGAVLRKGDNVLGSLWGIGFADELGIDHDPYRRVVEAELASEYLS